MNDTHNCLSMLLPIYRLNALGDKRVDILCRCGHQKWIMRLRGVHRGNRSSVCNPATT